MTQSSNARPAFEPPGPHQKSPESLRELAANVLGDMPLDEPFDWGADGMLRRLPAVRDLGHEGYVGLSADDVDARLKATWRELYTPEESFIDNLSDVIWSVLVDLVVEAVSESSGASAYVKYVKW